MWLPYGNKKHLVNLRKRLKLLVETAVSQLHSICTIPLCIVGQCVCLCLRVCVFVLTTSGGTLVARSWMAFPRMHKEERMNTIPRTTHALQTDTQTDRQREQRVSA